ncbi:MAG: thioredoxin [Rhodothermales bacterium]|nr:thioredoxin [Rhodothermales bacterium]
MLSDVQNFQEDVISASEERPVVVDFWAPWCGPCRVLGPTLEKLDSESGPEWTLVKVNTDENQNLAVEYGIRGIPAVKMFWKGQIVGEFTGALPEHAIRDWLGTTLPSGDKSVKAQILEAIEAGDSERAEKMLEKAILEDPADPFLAYSLAERRAISDPVAAEKIIANMEASEPSQIQIRDSIETLKHIHGIASGELQLPEGDVRDLYMKAGQDVVDGKLSAAIKKYIDVIGKERYYDDDGSRKACIALFTLLGPGHPVTRELRRTFDMILY